MSPRHLSNQEWRRVRRSWWVSSLRSPAKVNNPSAGLPKCVYEVFCKPSLAMWTQFSKGGISALAHNPRLWILGASLPLKAHPSRAEKVETHPGPWTPSYRLAQKLRLRSLERRTNVRRYSFSLKRVWRSWSSCSSLPGCLSGRWSSWSCDMECASGASLRVQW